ncbi:putative CCCH-type zinc finger family protein [Tanacetum coccineum]
MVGRRRTRNVNQLHEEPDPRDLEVNELRQLVQQLELHLERVEAPRQNHNERENDDSEKEYNPFHVTRSSESNDKEAHYQHNNRRKNRSQRCVAMRVKIVAIKLKKHASVCDVYKLAPKVEKQLKEKESRKSTTYSVSRGPSRGYVTNRASGSQSTKSVVTKASQTLHTHDVGAGPSRTKPKSVQCFKCKGFGHILSDCPNQRVFTMVEENVEDEDDIPPSFDEPQEDEYEDIIYGDTGELLVIQRALPIDQRCLVNFSIGEKYRDEVWCDVVLMDACHLLLGRPWQFDRQTVHDGLKNTYAFVMNGVKIVLGPSKFKTIVSANKEEGNLFISKSGFSEALQQSKVAYALVIKEVGDENPKLPDVLLLLLDQFQCIFANEIPAGLPHMRNFQHCTYLVPRATLPNKAAYRINPTENVKLQKQVDELLKKGMVGEIMSLCAVLILLVPKKDGFFRMCVDSKAVNKITIKYQFPIHRLDDMLELTFEVGVTRFVYDLVTSGKHILKLEMGCMSGWFVVIYFDDILVFSKGTTEHLEHLRQNFEVLSNQKLYVNLKKCEFMTHCLVFLDYVISNEGIHVDTNKIDAITSWPTPATIHKVRSFHGLQRFFQNFSSIVSPITECLKGGVFKWTCEAQSSFELINIKMAKAPVIALPNFKKVFELDCDASGCGLGESDSENFAKKESMKKAFKDMLHELGGTSPLFLGLYLGSIRILIQQRIAARWVIEEEVEGEDELEGDVEKLDVSMRGYGARKGGGRFLGCVWVSTVGKWQTGGDVAS